MRYSCSKRFGCHPVNGIPAEASMCPKHREVYHVHRDALKRLTKSCFEIGIGPTLASGAIRECRHRLKIRLLAHRQPPSDSANSRDSEKLVLRSVGITKPSSDRRIKVLEHEDSRPSFGSIASSPSSDLSTPGLVLGGGGESTSVTPLVTSAPHAVSESFAKQVRRELESLPLKSDAADAPQRAKEANKGLRRRASLR